MSGAEAAPVRRFALPALAGFAKPACIKRQHSRSREARMIPLDFSGKLAVVAGVGDDKGFAWHIAKALNAAGARLVFSTHPRLVNVVENILERDLDAESRVLPYGAGNLKVEK